jgi:ABC-2 type transport system permease protein
MVASIVKTEEAADQLAGFGVQIFSMLGGSMVPLFVFPEVMRNISLITPNRWALSGFLDVMAGISWADLFLTIVVLLAIGMVTLLIGIWRLQTR